MAITREQVTAAVERYLPRTVNFAQSADLGDRDLTAIYARITQIVLTNLLVDPDAVFYLIFLSSRRLLVQVDAVLEVLTELSSTDQLRGITGDIPTRIEDITKLTAARQSLVRLSTGLATADNFGNEALSDFKSNIEGFMSEGLVPNVAGGNRTKISGDIRASMETLKLAWAEVVDRRELVFALLDKYTEEDLRTRVSSIIISAIQRTLLAVEGTVLTLSTEQQAAQAEQVLVDLAAADAAITLVGDAVSPVGTIIAGPGDEGKTESSYLLLESTGVTEPILPVLIGEDGKLRLTGPGPGGAPFTGLTGVLTVPGAGGLSDRMTDINVADFVAEGIEAGMYITFVDLGFTSPIKTVTTSEILFDLKVPYLAGDHRYAITGHAPGEFFQDTVVDFWDEYTGASQGTFTTFVDGNTDGEFVRKNKAAGSDGTSVMLSGSVGVAYPYELQSPPDVAQSLGASDFTGTPGTIGFLTNLINTADLLVMDAGGNTGANPYTIASIDDDDTLTIVGTWAANSGPDAWHIEDPGADLFLDDATALFLSTPIPVSFGDILRITGSVSNNADFIIGAPVTQTRISIDPAFPAPFVHETGLSWEILLFDKNTLFSDTVNFLALGVVAGDKLEISGTASDDGTYTITEVGTGYVRISAGLLSGDTFSGASFVIYTDLDNEVTDRFKKTLGGDFDTLGVGSTMTVTELVNGVSVDVEIPTVFRVDGVDYSILELDPDDPADTLTIAPLSSGPGEFTSATNFEDLEATWVTDGVDAAKHRLVIRFGENAGLSFPISVVTETTLTVSGGPTVAAGEAYEILPILGTGLTWDVFEGLTTKHFFDSGNTPFTAATLGKPFVYRPGTAFEQRLTINSIVSTGEIYLSAPLPADETGFDYAIIPDILPGMQLSATSRRFGILEVVDKNTIKLDPKLSNAPGGGIVWRIIQASSSRSTSRIFDADGAAVYDALQGSPGLGFTSDLFNFRIDLMVDRPIQARFTAPYDPGSDGFSEAFEVNVSMPLGYRSVPYRIMAAFENQSNLFVADEVAPLPVADDTLAIWNQADIFRITSAASATPDMQLIITPTVAVELQAQSYVVTRGGSQYYGRYVLFDTLNDNIEVDDDTDLLRLKVAEVLIDYGVDAIVIDPGAATGTVVDDGDADGESAVFSDTTEPADFSTAKFGDRLTVTYPGPDVRVTFVSQVLSGTSLRVDPPLPEGTSLTWVLDRNSVSSSLEQINIMRGQMTELRELVAAYAIPRNRIVDAIIDLLVEQRLTRSIDLLYDGKVDEFLTVGSREASYSSRARGAIQDAGASTLPTEELTNNVAGIDPETGKRSPSSVRATSSHSVSPLQEDVNVRIAMADGISDIIDDERIRSLLFTTEEEQRNRAIYVLNGEVESGFISDEDPTLPWIAKTGSLRQRLLERRTKLLEAIQYMIDNPDKFCELDPAVTVDEAADAVSEST